MNKKLNIGIVANTAFNIYNFRRGLIKALKDEGHHVVAIAPTDDYALLLKEEGIEFIPVNNLARKGTNPIDDLMLVNEFRKIYAAQKLDVVLQYTIKPNIYGTLAARFTNTKSICTVTGLGYTFLNKSLGSSVARRLYRFAFSFADKVLFQNEDDRLQFIQSKLVSENKTAVVAGSGIDTDYFDPAICEAKKEDDITRFLMIGRLLRDKGVHEYAAAAKSILQQNKNVEFHLLGDIDNDNPSAIKKSELQTWIDEGTIIYHGHAKDTRPFICQSDCVVLPSYREGMPRVILEGMAMAKPCIATNVPGCRDAVEDGKTGFLCEAMNANDLSRIIQKFLSLGKAERLDMGNSSRNRVKSIYSVKIISETYIHLLRNIV